MMVKLESVKMFIHGIDYCVSKIFHHAIYCCKVAIAFLYPLLELVVISVGSLCSWLSLSI